MFCRLKQKIIYPAYVSKNNSKKFGKHVILLMILNGGGSNHITIKKLPALLTEIMLKYLSDFY